MPAARPARRRLLANASRQADTPAHGSARSRRRGSTLGPADRLAAGSGCKGPDGNAQSRADRRRAAPARALAGSSLPGRTSRNRYRGADACTRARLAGRTGRDGRAGARAVPHFVRAARPRAGQARASVGAEVADIAAGTVRHPRVAGRAGLDDLDLSRAGGAIGRVDRLGAADAGRGYVRGRAAGAAGGRNEARGAAERPDRNMEDRPAFGAVGAAWHLSGWAADAGRRHFAGEAAGAARRRIAAGTALRIGGARRAGGRRRRRQAFPVDERPRAAGRRAAGARVDLSRNAAEVAGADGRLPGGTAGIRAGGVRGERSDRAAPAADLDVGTRAPRLAGARADATQ